MHDHSFRKNQILSPAAAGKIHLLIVDDDGVDRQSCRRVLTQNQAFEFDFSEAETGGQGLQQVRERIPDCILLDHHLPDLNGLEFLVALSEQTGEISVPVIMLTGSDNRAIAVEAMKHGARDYLVKDTGTHFLELLPAVIHRVLREQRAMVERRHAQEALRRAHNELEHRVAQRTAELVEINERLMREIAERKLAEDALRIKDYAIESSITGIVMLSPRDGQLLYANPAFVKMFGYADAGEILGRHPAELCANPQNAHSIIEHLQNHDQWIGELDGRKKDGTVIATQFSGNLVRDGHGKPASMLATLVDITRLKRTEQREQWLNGIMHMSHSEIYVFDTDTLQFIEANKVALENIGYSIDELRKITPLDLEPSLTRERFEQRVSPLRNKQREMVVFEACHRRKDASIYPVEIRLQKIPLADAHPTFVAVILDITARRTAEEQMQKAKEAAEHANKDKTRFLAAASHDIRQPLQAATLYAAYLSRKVDNLESRKIIDMQISALSSLATMLDRLMDVSQLDSGAVKPQWQTFSVSDLLEKADTQFRTVAHKKGVDLRIVYNTSLIHSDPALLWSIIQNLVGNAIKYTESGRIIIGCRHRGSVLRMDVIDTGQGIPEDKIAKIFHEFYQLDNPARERAKGQGLGLAIVKRLTDLLTHPLDVKSVFGKGSRFSISVPFVRYNRRAHVRDKTSSPTILCHTHDAKRILLVDDDLQVLAAFRLLLEQNGHIVVAVSSSGQALEAAAKQSPDLIITDYRLPGEIDGFELASRLKSLLPAPRPVAIITGDTSGQLDDKAAEMSALLLYKPLNQEKLEVLNKWMS